ncbi:MAG TPA: carbohydrate ABC transporter permease [Alphaproteobacteria bacterium]|nr:carbohydrate ABC transporter permease [Alphaproteobacteria bacterium]
MQRMNYKKAINVLAVVVVILWLIPVIWVAINSIKPTNIINARIPTFYSFAPTIEHYVEIFDRFQFDRAMSNSLVTVGVSTLIVMILALPAAYAVARMGLMHGDTWALVILSLRFMPGVVIVLPYFKLAIWSGIHDTQILLIIVYVAFGLPFAVWILRGFLLDLPKEVEEAGRLDGLSWLQIIFRLILPMAAPGIAVTTIFTFVFSWNEYLFALFLTTSKATTMPVALQKTIDVYNVLWGSLSAGAMIQLLPMVLVVFLLQRHIARGLALGAVK